MAGAPEFGPEAASALSSHSSYQINARTELAVRYNDISPLENHHCAVAFQILAQPACNIFSNVQPDGFKQIRQVCGVRALRLQGGDICGETVSMTTEQTPVSSG